MVVAKSWLGGRRRVAPPRTAEVAESLSVEGVCLGPERVAGPSASDCRPPRLS